MLESTMKAPIRVDRSWVKAARRTALAVVTATLIGPTEVALKWNASARADYYRVFKKILGQSPTEYRAQLLGTR